MTTVYEVRSRAGLEHVCRTREDAEQYARDLLAGVGVRAFVCAAEMPEPDDDFDRDAYAERASWLFPPCSKCREPLIDEDERPPTCKACRAAEKDPPTTDALGYARGRDY